MITYPEYSKPAAATLGCKMVSVDIGGGMTYQGPATAAQQARLAGMVASIANENEELIGKMPEAIAAVQLKQKAAAEARKQAAADKSNVSAKQGKK